MLPQKKNIFLRWPFFTLFLFVVIAYLPVLLPFFHLKNDVITQNLPTRFFIGESVYSHFFPWWNPYMNFGFPQYADMNNGFWNPVLWFIAYFFNYSLLSITLEEIFYILIGGWGIYLLCKQFKNEVSIALLCSLAYMCGGFIVGHLQHFCWITGAGFFPFVVLFFVKCYQRPVLKNFIAGALFTFLFISSTHPGLIIGSLYFFLFITAYLFFDQIQKEHRVRLLKVCLFFLFFAVLFSPIIWVSDLEGIFHMTRGSKVNYKEALSMPTTLQSYLSLLYPTAINRGAFFATDISMRNMNIGLICLFGLFCSFRFELKKLWVIWAGVLFFILLAAGILKPLFYKMPLLGFVRLNGEFSYFVFLAFILLAAEGLDNAVRKEELKKKFQYFFKAFFLVFILSAVLSIFFIITKNNPQQFLGIKAAIENLTFWHLLLINSILQIVFLFFFKKYGFHKISFFIYAGYLIVLTWLSLPYTGIGQMSRSEVQSIINTVPKGIFKPYQKPIIRNNYIDSAYNCLFLEVAFYSKQIGYPNQLQYPVVMNSANNFFNDPSIQNFINKNSYLFLSTDTSLSAITNNDSTKIRVLSYSPTQIKTTIQNNRYNFLILLQNNYPRWKVFVDGKPVPHFTAFSSFIGIPLATGWHKVEFVFNVASLKRVLYLNIFIILSGLFVLSIKKWREMRLCH